MDDRKYRLRGYQQRDAGPRAPRREPGPLAPPREPIRSRGVSRCAACGAVLPVTADSLAQCPGCRAELHACRQCTSFDPGQRFECTQPIPERIADKQAVNTCASFALRVTVERDTSGGNVRPEDARRSFQNLFKK
jgi:hypothetical protein